MRTPILRRLSLRVRILLGVTLVVASFLPPYIPKASLIDEGEGETATPQFQFVEDGFLMKTSTLGTSGSRLAYTEGLVHTVQEGEGIDAIAKRYGISVQTIRWANGLTGGESVKAGQELIILPVDGVLHTVRRGQTLGRIAQLYDVAPDIISSRNNVHGGFIVAGQELIIPGGKPIGNPDVVTPGGHLQFASQLPNKDIALRFGSPSGTRPGRPTPPPNVSVTPTSGTLQMPCNNCSYTQYFHAGHYAVDIQTKGGGPVFAAEAGTVIRADYGWDGGYGNVIEIDHGNGLVTLYAHNKELHVKVGNVVKRGQVIADMGNTGLVYGATGIHTHFEVRQNGVKKNPLLYLEG